MEAYRLLKALINDLKFIKTNFTSPYYKYNIDKNIRLEYFLVKDDMRKLLKRCRKLLFMHKQQEWSFKCEVTNRKIKNLT